ncbi:hypothetical protein [Endozoicomonas sp. SESOKO1]|uniref:capsular polysaccharide export protein, LipB/KpsS family n=1 Tax=Endozoicomonas sp. SESOKO1 TaxID=2828742 RepID=UPI0021486C8A|nr:hypothetical protein [Endozoicomonas sp. SESOKO1]
MNKILWFVSTLEDTNFLNEFSKAYKGDIHIFCLNYITYFQSSFRGFRTHLPKQGKESNIQFDASKTFNVLSGRLTQEQAQKAYSNTIHTLSDIIRVSDYIFMIPSGRHVHHIAATDFAIRHSIKRIYINYSNFPGYTFFDSEGTDALSSIYKNPDKIDRLFPEHINIKDTFKKFSSLKTNQKNIPQADSGHSIIKRYAFIFDSIIQATTGVIGDRRTSFRIKRSDDFLSINYDQIDLKSAFIFFPMQVSTDQQVLVNYEGGGVVCAIKEALSYADKNKCMLYVREHPAEGDKNKIRTALESLRKDNERLKIVNNSVADLIKNAHEVITINSTIGLECRINYKKITFLGKSFYEKATNEQLAKYLSNYLIPVDYHAPSITEEAVLKILRFADHV